MIITEEKVDTLLSKVKINLKKEDYEPQVKKRIKTMAKEAQIKGFRPGMVPLDLVKKMYGNSVLVEELNKLLNEEVYKYINENKIEILASPIPASDQRIDFDINGLKDIDFAFEVGLAPEVSLEFIEKAPDFDKYKIRIEDKMVDEEVARIRKRYATFEYPETVGETDVLTFTFEELDNEGNLKPEGISSVSSVTVDQLKPEAKDKILQLKKQESVDYNVFELMDRDREAIAKTLLNMSDLDKLPEVGDRFRMTLNNITRSVPAEMNKEFFVMAYGEDGPKTEEELRNNIKADLDAYFEGKSDSYLVNELYKGIMEHLDFPLPDTFLRRWIGVTNEKPISEEDLEKEYPSFAKSLRWSLIQKKIVHEQNLDVTEEEIRDKVRANMIQQLHSYGMKGIGEEWVEQFVQKQLAEKKVVSQTKEQLLEDKVLGYVKSKANLLEKEIGFQEFKDMVEKGNENDVTK